jgi:hypothetical protein
MNHTLILITLLFIILSAGCKQKEVDSFISPCYPNLKLSRSHQVVDAPAVVEASGGLATGFQLVSSNGVKWSSCNLAQEYGRPNLQIYVSGYFVTSPELEAANITPLPFIVTSAKLR